MPLANQDQIRLAFNDRLQRETGIGNLPVGSDIVQATYLHGIIQDRSGAGNDQRVGPDDKERFPAASRACP